MSLAPTANLVWSSHHHPRNCRDEETTPKVNKLLNISSGSMKFVERHPFANPDKAARKLAEIANGVEAVQNGRIYIERVNEPFLAAGGSAEQFRAGIERAIALGWRWRHER